MCLTQWKNVFISNLIAKLQSNRDKLFMPVLDGPTRVDAQLDLLFRNRGDPAGDVLLSGSLGCSDHKQEVVKSLRGVRKKVVEHRSWTLEELTSPHSGN